MMDGAPTLPRPELAEMRRHLKAIFAAYGDSALIEVTAISPDGAPAITVRREELDRAVEFLDTRNAERRGCYLSPARRKEDAPRERRCSGRDVAGTRWLWLDFDDEGAAEAAEAALADLDLEPTFWVTTGTQPWPRRQAWWRLAQEIPAHKITRALRAMAQALGADRSAVDPSRVMRLAGSINWAKHGKPERTDEVVVMGPVASGSYDVADFERAFGRGDAMERAKAPPATATAEEIEEVRRLLETRDNTLTRQDWVRLAIDLRGACGDAVEAEFMDYSYQWPGAVDGAPEKLWRSARPRGGVTIATALHLLRGEPIRREVAAAGFEVKQGSTQKARRNHRDLKVRAFADDLEPLLDDAWLIHDVLPDQGLGCAYGAPGCGKTFVALDMAFAVAGAASTWRGREVEPGAVLYLGMEGGRLFQNRVAAYAREKGEAPHFYRSAENLNLRSTDDDARAVVAECLVIAERDRPVKLVVVDTLSRALHGGNENAPDDMGALVAQCEAIRKAVGCYLLLVHHSGKDEAKGMRGHTVLLGAVDTEIHLNDGVMRVCKQRDGESGTAFGYTLRRVELGLTPKGRPVTSCVVEEVAAPTGPQLTPHQQLMLEIIREIVASDPVPVPAGKGFEGQLGADNRGVRALMAERLTNGDLETRKRTARRVLSQQREARIVYQYHEVIWMDGS